MKLYATASAIHAHIISRFSSIGVATIFILLSAIPAAFAAISYYPNQYEKLLLEKQRLESARGNERAEANLKSIHQVPSISTVFIEPTFITNVSQEFYATAEKNRISILRISLKEDKSSSNLPRNVEIQIVVTGTYPQIRQLAMSSLNKIEALGLQSIQFKRRLQDNENQEAQQPNKENGAPVEAQLNFRLFVVDKS